MFSWKKTLFKPPKTRNILQFEIYKIGAYKQVEENTKEENESALEEWITVINIMRQRYLYNTLVNAREGQIQDSLFL